MEYAKTFFLTLLQAKVYFCNQHMIKKSPIWTAVYLKLNMP